MKNTALHGSEPVSGWVARWSHLVKPQGSVLDVACGRGRHAKWFYERNHAVADIENGPWPFTGRQFDAVVVTNYLWRPLFPSLLASLALGGVFIYETFTAGNETVGKPSRPDFLLRTGELLVWCKPLRIVAFEDVFEAGPAGESPRFMQRIAAVREATVESRTSGPGPRPAATPARYRLS